MKLSIVIVNYNVEHFLEQCLISVRKAIDQLDAEIFVVDNNSVDGSVSMINNKFKDVKLIANKENVGFSSANNQAIKLAQGEYVLLLNPDTVVEEDTFKKCIQFMDNKADSGGLGVKMIDGKGKFLPESKRGLPTPSVAFYKKIFGDNGAIRLLFDVYSNNSDAFSSAEKMRMTKAVITDMIPFLSAAEKLIFGALTDEWTADITKTGADTGLETTSGEQIWKALLSAPDSRTTMLWDQTGKNIDKKADIRAEAKRAVQIYRKSRGNKPMEVDEVKEFLVVWKFKLNKGTLVTNTLEHNEFMDQALTMIAQQDVSFAEKFYREFKKDFKYDAPYYSDSTIEQIRTLKATLSRKFPDSIEELNEMEAWMLDANDAYKQGN